MCQRESVQEELDQQQMLHVIYAYWKSIDRDWRPMNGAKILQIDDNRSSEIPPLATGCKTINGASNFARVDVLFSTIQS